MFNLEVFCDLSTDGIPGNLKTKQVATHNYSLRTGCPGTSQSGRPGCSVLSELVQVSFGVNELIKAVERAAY